MTLSQLRCITGTTVPQLVGLQSLNEMIYALQGTSLLPLSKESFIYIMLMAAFQYSESLSDIHYNGKLGGKLL